MSTRVGRVFVVGPATAAISSGTAPYSNLVVTGLPSGITYSLSGSTISFGGAPTVTGVFNNIQVSVADAAGAIAKATFGVTIYAMPAPGALSATQWTAGQPYNGTIAIASNTLTPSGLSITGLPPGIVPGGPVREVMVGQDSVRIGILTHE